MRSLYVFATRHCFRVPMALPSLGCLEPAHTVFEALTKSLEPARFTKVFIDISGSRDLATVFRMMDLIDKIIRPDAMVVKSQALKKMMLRTRLWIEHPLNQKVL